MNGPVFDADNGCKACATGCSKCTGTGSCDVCTKGNCNAGQMYDYKLMKCADCKVKGCMTCQSVAADVEYCDECFAGYTRSADNLTCVADEVDKVAQPCPSGYWRESTNTGADGCTACKDGCASCTSATNCMGCNAGVTWT